MNLLALFRFSQISFTFHVAEFMRSCVIGHPDT